MKQPSKYNIEQPIEDILRRWWGYTEFRPMQREIIESVLAGRDTLALMPTGGGKSLTYQIPAMAVEGLTIVVTPLIALMKDQVDRLRQRGIPAVAVHSGMEQRKIEIALDNCTYGDVKLLYIAPERLASEAFRVRLRYMKVSFVAVDEAHCISQWGYDFRPSYLHIADVREMIPDATFLALTASATELVAKDIMHHLRFSTPNLLRSSFARPNLAYAVREVEDKYDQLLRVARNVEGSGIVYMRTREGCEQLAEQMAADGLSVKFYHAGLPALERAIRQEEWSDGRVRIMVATNAFGMGIDKADVRFVVHYSMCDSLEAYYQEAGRAGRDGVRSYAVLLAAKDDASRIENLFRSEFPPLDRIKHIYERIANYLQVAIGDGDGASFIFNIYDFCHREQLSATLVASAIDILSQNGYMSLLDEHDNPAKLMFMCSRDSLYRLNAGGNDMDMLLRTILRMYNGVFSGFRSIDELQIAAMSKLSSERVHELLKMLWRMNVIRYIPASRSPMIHFMCERLPIADVYISPDSYRRRYDIAYERFRSMYEYVVQSDECRSVVIQRYFGDGQAEPCGVCDICLSRRKKRARSGVAERIFELIEGGELSVKEVVAQIGGNSDVVVGEIEKLVGMGKISISTGGKLKKIE